MRLVLRDLRAGEQPETLQAIGAAALVDRLQARQLALVGGHDDLAAPFPADPVGVAEFLHEPRALDAEAGLQRAGLVVDAGMDDAAVVARLVGGQTWFLVEDGDAGAGVGLREGQGGRQPDDTAPDERDIHRLGHGQQDTTPTTGSGFDFQAIRRGHRGHEAECSEVKA